MVATSKARSGFREGLVNDIQQACVAMRVSMETHVAKEEAELWPLFEKHFSFEEQEKIVGQIIGRTGAEVLRSMLIWVRNALNEDEREGMISSMRHATQNTRFAQWMNTWYSGKVEDLQTIGDDWVKSTAMDDDDASAPTTKTNAAETAAVSSQDGMRQVHAYLSRRSGDVDKETFKPGWEDIFRMNQIQLEDAVRTVNRDDTLAPTKKAYLIQNLLASRWIVGNQLQAQKDKTTELSSVGSAQKIGRACDSVPARRGRRGERQRRLQALQASVQNRRAVLRPSFHVQILSRRRERSHRESLRGERNGVQRVQEASTRERGMRGVLDVDGQVSLQRVQLI